MDVMRKRCAICICTIFMTVVFCVSTIIIDQNSEAYTEASNADLPTMDVKETMLPTSEKYIITDFDGTVSVFLNETEKDDLIIETDICMDGLRKTDQRMLQSGIETNSYENVLKLLEDLNS